MQDIYGLGQDCSNSIANALELLQSCTKSSIFFVILCSDEHNPLSWNDPYSVGSSVYTWCVVKGRIWMTNLNFYYVLLISYGHKQVTEY